MTLVSFETIYYLLSLLQYISFYFNIKIATFVGLQIAVYAYVVLRTFTYTSPSSPSKRLPDVLFVKCSGGGCSGFKFATVRFYSGSPTSPMKKTNYLQEM